VPARLRPCSVACIEVARSFSTIRVFTTAEITYLNNQRLGRLATVGTDNRPHVVPVGFRYNPDEDALEIGGHGGFANRKKYRDVLHNPRIAFVVDDVVSVNPWTVRGIEIRGQAEIVTMGARHWVRV